MISSFGIIILIIILLGYDLLKDRNKSSVPRKLTEKWSETGLSIKEAHEISDEYNEQGYYTEIIAINPREDTFEVRILI